MGEREHETQVDSRDEFLEALLAEVEKPVGAGLSGSWCRIRT